MKHRMDFEICNGDFCFDVTCETWLEFYNVCVEKRIAPICYFNSFEDFRYVVSKTSSKKTYELENGVFITVQSFY